MEIMDLFDWKLIPIEAYEPPQQPTVEVVRKGLMSFFQGFRKEKEHHAPLADLNELIAVPPLILDKIATPPATDLFLPALRRTFNDWAREEQSLAPVQVVVYPPGSLLKNSLISWAKEVDWWVMEPPLPPEILQGGDDWLAKYEQNAHQALLIPDLSKLYLQHHFGLDLVRQLLNWLWLRKRHCLIGCSSWAWTFLSRVIQIDTILPSPLVVEPFDARLLENWFELQARQSDRYGFKFRQIKNGKSVFLTEGIDGEGGSDYLKMLAAYSRGDFNVAWALWRVSLQYGGDEAVNERVRESAGQDRRPTIWVKDLDHLALPKISAATREVMFVLHALLLHNGLPLDELVQILPLSSAIVMQTLHVLKNNTLVFQHNNVWQVSPLAYPAVKKGMLMEGYMGDGL